MSTHNKQLDRLKVLLKELFQLDKPELDFGLYKIMHAKSEQITQFLDNDLLKEVEAAFGAESADRVLKAEQKVAEAIEQATSFGAPDPEVTPAVTQARADYKLALEGGNTQAEIYDHLYRFFERYYDNGDFLSKRYYARENDSRAAPYSVPYDGREVYLHWANKDQYYIKSGEHLNNFSFDLTQAVRLNRQAQAQQTESLDLGDSQAPSLKVHMHLAQAQEGEHGNIKAAGDQKREFIPLLSRPLEFNEQGELVLNFEYKTLPDGYPIDAAAEAALKAKYDFKNKGDLTAHWMADVFLQALPKGDTRYLALLAEAVPTDTQKKRPLLAKYIQQYTARNTMDYFIHKNLGGFLKRELDFYIKNELMRLDDIENADAPRVEQYLGKLKALRRVAHRLIAFLAQLEDFQKKLWLKKKFVTETNYCITLDRVPESLYPDIAANDAQREEWVKLFAIDEIVGDTAQVGYSVPLTVDFLTQNPFLVIDTALYEESFKESLLVSQDCFDLNCDGLLIHSDNFHGLNHLGRKLKKQVKYIYIDPPYNTASTPIIYKNEYKKSSWASLVSSRLNIAKNLLTLDGLKTIAIDDTELNNLSKILEEFYSDYRQTKLTVIHNPKGSITRDFNRVHEYSIFLTPRIDGSVIARILEENDKPRRMRRWGENSLRTERRLSFYPIYVKGSKVVRFGNVPADDFHPASKNIKGQNGEVEIWPIDQDGVERRWNFGLDSIEENLSRIIAIKEDGLIDIYVSHELTVPKTVWTGGSYDAGNYGNTLLINMLGSKLFDFPKSINLVQESIHLATANHKNAIVLDYFGGSGTTAHAVIRQNRKDGGQRKYVLVEVGVHFDTVIFPRTLKAIYSTEWKDGKPIQRDGISHCFKYLRLESYEDTLNNLSLQTDPARERALADNPELRQDYVLNYWLDVETQGSQSLLNVAAFRDPTAYTMRIKQPGSDVQRLQRIDLIETFNWLIGLWVEHMAAPQTLEAEFKREVDPVLPKDQHTRLACTRTRLAESGPYWFRLVEGYTLKVPGDDSSRQKTLVVWRKLTDDAEKDNAVLQHFLMEKLAISPREHTYAVIFVNGSHTLPNPVVEGEQTKVRLIEEAFHSAMWAQDGV